MKRAVSVVLAVLCGAILTRAPAFASIVLVQTATAGSVFATSNSVTFTNPVSTGDVVGVIVDSAYGSGQCVTAPTATDSASDTPIAATAWNVSTSNWCTGVYLFVVSAGSSSFKITVSYSSSANIALLGFDYSGVKTTAPIDGSATALATGTGTAVATASLTPAQSGDEQLAFLITGSATTVSAWSGTLAQQAILSISPQAVLADANLSSTSAVTASATLASSEPWGMSQLLLAPGSGGSSCSHDGYTAQGTLALPNGTSGSYWLKNGTLGTPNCSSVEYWQPKVGNFGVN